MGQCRRPEPGRRYLAPIRRNQALEQVLRRWLAQCLCLALDVAEQKKMHCQYAFSIYQAEYSRNLLFRGGRDLKTVSQVVIDRTRAGLDIKTVTPIFGYKHRPNPGKAKREPRLRVVTENLRMI